MMPKTPGELVGAYHIEGKLTENTCGAQALPAANQLSFNVQVRDNKGEGLWVRDMPPPYSGRLDDDGSFAFDRTTSYDVQAMAKDPAEAASQTDPAKLADPSLVENADQAAMKHCRLAVDESVQGRLLRDSRQDGGVTKPAAASSATSDLVGDNEISIHAGSGADCKMALAAQGGPFEQLPCRAHYELKGDLKR
jgi:hypothetical protein